MSERALRALGATMRALDLFGEYARDPAGRRAALGRDLAEVVARATGDAAARSPGRVRGDAAIGAGARRLGTWENVGRARARRLRRHGLVSHARHADAAQAKQSAHARRSGPSTRSISRGSTAARSAVGFGEERASYPLPAETAQGRRESRSSSTCSTCGATAACTGPRRNACCASRMARSVPLDGLGIPGSAARICAPPRAPWEPTAGINMLYNAHDRAARQIRPARRRVVPGRGQRRARRARRYEAQLTALYGRLAPAVRCAAAVPRRAARELRPAGECAGGQRLGAPARCAAARGRGRRQRRPRGDHRHRQSRRHSSAPTSRMSAGGWRARRGTWCMARSFRLGRAAEDRRGTTATRCRGRRSGTSTARCIVDRRDGSRGAFELCGADAGDAAVSSARSCAADG